MHWLRFCAHMALGGSLWWLLSGLGQVRLLTLGLLSAALVVWLARRMDAIDGERHPFRLQYRFIQGLLWLAGEVFKSNLDVARRVLMPGPPISPNLLRLEHGGRTELGCAILANAITLTPGTVTLDVSDDWLEVHALSRAAARALLRGEMARRLPDIGRPPPGPEDQPA